MRSKVLRCKVCQRFYTDREYKHKAACGPRCELVYQGRLEFQFKEQAKRMALKQAADKERGLERKRKRKQRKREAKKTSDKLSESLTSLRRDFDSLKSENRFLRKNIESFKKKPKTEWQKFYESREWQEVRYFILKRDGRTCVLCRTTTGELHVDHIIPRSKAPHLSLDPSNLQVLCKSCNLGKSNNDDTDFRVLNNNYKGM